MWWKKSRMIPGGFNKILFLSAEFYGSVEGEEGLTVELQRCKLQNLTIENTKSHLYRLGGWGGRGRNSSRLFIVFLISGITSNIRNWSVNKCLVLPSVPGFRFHWNSYFCKFFCMNHKLNFILCNFFLRGVYLILYIKYDLFLFFFFCLVRNRRKSGLEKDRGEKKSPMIPRGFNMILLLSAEFRQGFLAP